MAETAKLTVDGKTLELPIVTGPKANAASTSRRCARRPA